MKDETSYKKDMFILRFWSTFGIIYTYSFGLIGILALSQIISWYTDIENRTFSLRFWLLIFGISLTSVILCAIFDKYERKSIRKYKAYYKLPISVRANYISVMQSIKNSKYFIEERQLGNAIELFSRKKHLFTSSMHYYFFLNYDDFNSEVFLKDLKALRKRINIINKNDNFINYKAPVKINMIVFVFVKNWSKNINDFLSKSAIHFINYYFNVYVVINHNVYIRPIAMQPFELQMYCRLNKDARNVLNVIS